VWFALILSLGARWWCVCRSFIFFQPGNVRSSGPFRSALFIAFHRIVLVGSVAGFVLIGAAGGLLVSLSTRPWLFYGVCVGLCFLAFLAVFYLSSLSRFVLLAESTG